MWCEKKAKTMTGTAMESYIFFNRGIVFEGDRLLEINLVTIFQPEGQIRPK